MVILTLLLAVAIAIAIQVPAVQQYAVNKGAGWFGEKTGGQLSVAKFDLRIPSYLLIEGVVLKDRGGRDVAKLDLLELKLGWRQLFQQRAVIDELNINGLNATIYSDTSGTWNYDFILDAFAGEEDKPAYTNGADTTKTENGWDVALKKLRLHDIDLSYYDATSRDSFHVSFEDLRLRMQSFSIQENRYHAERLYFAGAYVSAQLGPGSSEEKDDEAGASEQDSLHDPALDTTLPDLLVGLLILERQDLHFTDLSDGSRYSATLDHLRLTPEKIDLTNDTYAIEDLEVAALNLDMWLPESPPSEAPFDGDIFAPLTLDAKQISIAESAISIHTLSEIRQYTKSDTSIEIAGISLQVSGLQVREDRYELEVEQALFTYNGLPSFQHLSLGARITPKAIDLSSLEILWGPSSVSADAAVSYSSLAALVNDLKFAEAKINLKKAHIHPESLASLLEMANPDSALPALPAGPISAELRIAGNAQQLNLSSLKVSTGQTKLNATGKSKGPELSKHHFIFDQLNLSAHLDDMAPWLPDSLDREMLPSHINFNGNAEAGPQASGLHGWVSLLPFGEIKLDATTGGWESDKYDLQAHLESAFVDLASLAESDTFYTCFSLNAHFFDLLGDTLRGHVLLDLPEFRMDHIRVSHLIMADTIDGDFHRFGLSVNDSSITATLAGMADLEHGIDVVVDADIAGIDFEYLGLAREDIRLRTGFSAAYIQHDSLQMGRLHIEPSVVVRIDERADVAAVEADFFFGPDSTGFQLLSEQVTLRSTSNLSIEELIRHGKDLFKDEVDDDQASEAYWQLDFRTGDLALLHDLLLTDLDRFDPAEARVRYTGYDRRFDATVSLPHIDYGSITIDSTALSLRSDQGSTTGSFGIRHLAYDTLSIDHIGLTMNPDTAGTAFRFYLGGPPDEAPYRIGANLRYNAIEPDGHWVLAPFPNLHMAGKEWAVDPQAAIHFADTGTEILDLNLTRNQQALRFSKEGGAETLFFEADRFKLQTLAEVFSQEEELFAGLLDAQLEVNSDGTFIGKGLIEGLHLLGADFGQLKFGGESIAEGYHLSAKMDGPALDMDVEGTIAVVENGSQNLDLELKMKRFSAKTLEYFAPDLIKGTRGTASGQATIKGPSANPAVTGEFQFNDISMQLKGSGQYGLQKEVIRLEPKAIVFPNFQITDSAGYKLNVDGRIHHSNFQDLRYDLTVKSDRFTLLDVKKGEEEMYYGKLIVGSDIRITGTQTLPVIRSDISLKRGSEFVFLVPESDYSTFDDDGLVEWISFDQKAVPDILGKEKEVSAPTSVATFIDLAGNLLIDKEAKFRIVIDPLAGDYLEVEGGGKLALGYDRAGRINLSGTYTVSSGAYQMTFYNIVKRRFLIEPGSRITWNGDPFSADLNLTAIYPTRASALGLLNTTTSGAGSEGMRRMLDWEVLMNISGELEQPEIGFDLRMDKNSQTSRGSMSGAIESRLAQLRENESELNMQVFALMVFNTFISEGGGGMSGGDMVSNQARNSASQLLTQQLNNLSDKLVGGVELTFDLQSYGSEGATETDLSVDLSKTLFDDRVVVRVGSTVALEQNDPLADQSQQLMTNFIVEYKITQDGRYRLKAFRKTDVEDILVGRITRTGAGVVFRRSFDRGDQIFRKDESEKEIDAVLEEERKQAKEEKNNQKNGENGGN